MSRAELVKIGRADVGDEYMRAGCVVIAALLFVALAGAAGTALAREPQQPEKLPEIKRNAWVDAKARYIRPRHTIRGSSWATGDGYCGSTYRSKMGTIIFRPKE